LEEAVRIHLVSDVPLGAFLSGGLDSSSVVALMRVVTDGPIRTCSMVFQEAAYSEARYAHAVAQAVHAEHYERLITVQDVVNELDRILWAMDQPTIDGINTYFVSQTAREAGLTVALSGLGGDELFGGYHNTFWGVPQVLQALRLAQSLPAGAYLARTVLALIPGRKRWAKVADALTRQPSLASAYLACRGLFAPSEVQALATPDVWYEALKTFDPVQHIADRAANNARSSTFNSQSFSWVSRAELRTYTHHQLLRDTDVMSMAHSLEVRVPLLDHRLVEAVLRLPAATKLNGTGPKALLLRCVGDLLPSMVRERHAKQGFTFPFDVWLRGPLRGCYLEWQQSLKGWLRAGEVAKIQYAYQAGKLHWSRPWALAVLGGWMSAGEG
jgi:asparagine synthase (glutamine-hydrolysing)